MYSKSLQDIVRDGVSLADYYMEYFKRIFDELSEKTSIPYKIKSYQQLQADPIVRRALLDIIHERDRIIPIISSSTKKLHLRFPCPVCRFTDKHAQNQVIEVIYPKTVKVTGHCFEHNTHNIIISENNQDFFDVNTALYDLLLGMYLIESDQNEKTLSVMVDGGDYAGVWATLIHGEALLELGYKSIPSRLFSPLILDWSGAKFSKSLHVKHGAYEYLSEGLIDFSKFDECYGKEGFERLWLEAKKWAENPSKFFRNYSVDYFRLILAGDESVNVAESRKNCSSP